MSGTDIKYFSFEIPEGMRSLFLVVRILYADEADVMLDFYATRNFLWTKKSPYRTEQHTAKHLPAVKKDIETSTRLPFQVTTVLVRMYLTTCFDRPCYCIL